MLALFQIATGKPADAEPYLVKLAEVSKDSRAQLMLADYYLIAGRTEQASALLHKLTSTKSRSDADLRLASIDFRQKRREEARKRLDELPAREPGNARLWSGRPNSSRTKGIS